MSAETSKKHVLFQNVAPEHSFKLIDGSELHGVLDLIEALAYMSDDVFYYHVSDQRNDFSSWLRDAFNSGELADLVAQRNNQAGTQVALLRYVVNQLRTQY